MSSEPLATRESPLTPFGEALQLLKELSDMFGDDVYPGSSAEALIYRADQLCERFKDSTTIGSTSEQPGVTAGETAPKGRTVSETGKNFHCGHQEAGGVRCDQPCGDCSTSTETDWLAIDDAYSAALEHFCTCGQSEHGELHCQHCHRWEKARAMLKKALQILCSRTCRGHP